MNHQPLRWIAVAGTALLAACLGSAPSSSPPTGTSGSTVLMPDEYTAGRSVLNLIQMRMSNVQIRPASPCPDVEFRGRRNVQRATPPTIYVQGQRASNTCILESLNMADVDRVEVYRRGQGFHSAGFAGGAGGTILIYLKDGGT
jgi:hypothetical protein